MLHMKVNAFYFGVTFKYLLCFRILNRLTYPNASTFL